MRKFLVIISGVFVLSVSVVYGQAPITDRYVQHIITTGRQYIIAILRAGPNQSLSEDSVESEQMAHLKYLFRLREDGKLPIFGPFFNSGDLRGFCIFNSTSMGEVKSLMEADPHIRSGYLEYELHSWFGIPGDALPKQ